MFRSSVIASVCVSILLTTQIPAAAQGDVSAEEATRKVNIAGRQRMLSQRMAKAACMIAQGISTDTSYDQMRDALALFEASDNALRRGDPSVGLQVERAPEVLTAFADLDPAWDAYRALIEAALENGEVPQEQLTAFDDASLQVLRLMNISVFQLARTYADAEVTLEEGQTITVDVAGRQRMLTQRGVKEACMMRIADDPMIYADRLAETVQLFDLSLSALQIGYEQVGVIAAPAGPIETQLEEVRNLWNPIKEVMDRAAAGEVLGRSELARLQRDTEVLLHEMDRAVGLYEATR